MKKILLSFILLTASSIVASAQCTETYAPATFLPATTNYLAGQSFTAPCSGLLNYVQVTANTVGVVPAGTLNVYAGNSTATVPIHTQSFASITVANVGDPVQIIISGSVPITNASQYTFEFFMNLDVQANTTYTGGNAFQSGTPTPPISVAFEADITVATGISETNVSNTSIYPNPATNVLNITTDNQLEKVSIFSVNGALVKTDNQSIIDISNLNKGMYILTVQTDNGITQTRFIKE